MEPANSPAPANKGIRSVTSGIMIVAGGVYAGVPRGFYAEYQGSIFRFKCAFNDARDDYEDFFTVAAVPEAVADDFATGNFYQNTYDEIPLEPLAVSDVFLLDPMRPSSRSPNFELEAEAYLAKHKNPAAIPLRSFEYLVDTPRAQFFLYLDKIIAVFLLTLGLASILARGFDERSIFLFPLVALILLNPWTPNRWRIYRQAKWNTNAWEEYLVIFSDIGIRFRSGSSTVESTWAQYEGYLETPAVFLLLHRKSGKEPWCYTSIPNRGFASHSDIGALRLLLSQKIRR